MPTVAQPLRELPELRKMGHRLVAVHTKKQDGECWQFVQWLHDHWHIAAVTAQYVNGLEAES
jgi:hypothetical protein